MHNSYIFKVNILGSAVAVLSRALKRARNEKSTNKIESAFQRTYEILINYDVQHINREPLSSQIQLCHWNASKYIEDVLELVVNCILYSRKI